MPVLSGPYGEFHASSPWTAACLMCQLQLHAGDRQRFGDRSDVRVGAVGTRTAIVASYFYYDAVAHRHNTRTLQKATSASQ